MPLYPRRAARCPRPCLTPLPPRLCAWCPRPPLSAHPLPFYPGPRRVPRRARSRLVTLWSWEWGCVCSCYGKCCGCASLCVFVALCVVLSLLSSSPPLHRPANACTSTVVASIYPLSFVRERSTYTFSSYHLLSMPSRGASSDLLVLFCSSDLVLFFLIRELSSSRSLVGLFNDRVLCRRVISVRVHTLWPSLPWVL